VDSAVVTRYREVMTVEPSDSLSIDEQRQLEHRFGAVWGAEGLARKERRLVTITCVAFAVTPEPIAEHVYAALKSGDLTIEEMLEVVLHFAVYCGWPKASNLEMYVRQAWIRVQEEQGVEPKPLPSLPIDDEELGSSDWELRLARGAQEFADVNLVPAPPSDSPYQHAGILNFVFGHVWQRPRLGRRERRFVTVACVGVCEAPIPIWSHVGSALRSGELTKTEMDEIVRQFRAYDDDRRADALEAAVANAWNEMQASPPSTDR
jgi:4-carboxymuconolactone decarboxylase